VNTLSRQTGDIELVDYIEPSQPSNVYYPNQFDLINNQFPVMDRISHNPSYYRGSNADYFRTGSLDGININCCLENNINLDSIFISLILIILLFFFIKYYLFTKLYTIKRDRRYYIKRDRR
jgi:hypothetical protein